MKELLLKLSEKMPEGWSLMIMGSWARLIADGGNPYYDLGDFTDIGLAPLTALLKQSLNNLRVTKGTWEAGHSKAGQTCWSVWCDGLKGGLHFEEVSFKETEFEAVANAYWSTKEAE